MAASAWTGGQYSLLRALLGAVLLARWLELMGHRGELAPLTPVLDPAPLATGLLVVGAASALLLAVGFQTRVAALVSCVVWWLLLGRAAFTDASVPCVSVLLIVHAGIRSGAADGPYGAWSTRGRPDPAGGWRMAPGLWRVAWIILIVGYASLGFAKLGDPSWRDGSALARSLASADGARGLGGLLRGLPDAVLRSATYVVLALELGFALLIASRRLRPIAWGTMLAMHVVLLLPGAPLATPYGVLMLHLFTFDPAWIRGRGGERGGTVFYDGTCGLCHRAVRFALAEDPNGGAFDYAPLQGTTFEAQVAAPERAGFPDSILVRRRDGALLSRSNAIIHLLRALGGIWTPLGGVLALVPRPVRDLVYDGVARVRKRIFAKPAELCPVLPAHLAERFLP